MCVVGHLELGVESRELGVESVALGGVRAVIREAILVVLAPGVTHDGPDALPIPFLRWLRYRP
jgi:hypothetical protein